MPSEEDTGSLLGQERPSVSLPVARVRKSDVAVLVEIDAATSQLLGWGAGDMVGRTSLEFIHPDDQQLAVDNWMQMPRHTAPAVPCGSGTGTVTGRGYGWR